MTPAGSAAPEAWGWAPGCGGSDKAPAAVASPAALDAGLTTLWQPGPCTLTEGETQLYCQQE